MDTIEDKLLTALRNALLASTDPVLTVTEAPLGVEQMADRSVTVIPLTLPREPATCARQRWHLGVLVLVRAKLVAATPTTSAYREVFAAVRAALEAISAETFAAAVRAAGAEQARREPVTYWTKPPGGVGHPAGGLFVVRFDFTDV